MANEKITVDEYIDKYNKNSKSKKNIKFFIVSLTTLIGIAIAAILFFVTLRLFELSEIAGYIGIVASVIIFIAFYVVPLCQIGKTKSFETNIRGKNPAEVKKYNKELRREISNKIIDLYKNADTGNWYSAEKVKALVAAKNNDKELSVALKDILTSDVKKTSNKVIVEHSLAVFAATAISQSEKLDSLFVAISEVNLIRKIVLLYGFRPSEEKMMKIYRTVLVNAILSYGAQKLTSSLAAGIGKKIAESASSISIFGSAIETVLGSAVDGLANLTFTVKVGTQTKKYLMQEFNLQELLDEMEIPEDIETEEIELIKEAKSNTSKIKSANKKTSN